MEIVNFRQNNPGEKIVAIFDIYLGPKWGITYRNWKLIRGRNGTFISAPSFSEEKDGERIFYPYVEMSREKKQDFEEKVKNLLKGYIEI